MTFCQECGIPYEFMCSECQAELEETSLEEPLKNISSGEDVILEMFNDHD